VLEALRGERTLHKLWIAEGTHGTEEILKLAREKGIPIERSRRDQLDRRVQGHHQGVLAQAAATAFLDLEGFLSKLGPTTSAVLVALDEIEDPHNIGAILRSAGFFGVAGAIVPRWRSAPVGETAARVSSGAIEHVPLIRVRNLAESIETLKDANFEVIGADMAGSSLEEYQPSKRTTLVMGSEGKGLRRLVQERCDKLLKISGAGRVESLNVSAAAAIFLNHFCRKA